MQEIVNYLKKNKMTISTMESCTGGNIANGITNIEGASNVFKFSAITYSNEFKIKMGVDKIIIDKYSVYSIETAKEMSKVITNYSDSNYGVGITGKLNKVDENNGEVFISIYDKNKDSYYTENIIIKNNNRIQAKEEVINKFIEMFKEKVISK